MQWVSYLRMLHKKKTFGLLLMRSGFTMNLSGEENKKYKAKYVTGNVEQLTHFSEMSPRFRLSAFVKAVIPLLLIELL